MNLLFKRINDDRNFSVLSSALFFLILLPMPSFLSEAMQFRFIVIMCVAIALFYLIIKFPTFKKSSLVIFLLFFSTFMSIFFFNSLRFTHPDHLEELLRIPITFLFYLYAVSLIYSLNFDESSLIRVFQLLFVLLLIQIIFIFLDLTALKEPLSYIYQKEKLTLTEDISQKFRFVGSFENPNYLAYFASSIFPFAYFFRRKGQFSNVIFISLTSLVLVILSGSRTGLIVLMIQFIMLFPFYSLVIILFLGPSIVLFLSGIKRFSGFFEFGSLQLVSLLSNDASFNVRLDSFNQALPLINQEWLLGYGYVPFNVIDNFYIKFMLRYGLAGLSLVIFSLFIFIAIYRIKAIKLLIYFIFPLLIFNLTGAFFDNFRLLLITFLLAVLWFRLLDYKIFK